MFSDYDFGSGVAEKHIDFDIDPALSMSEQMWSCKEDMLQVAYSNDYTIDIGWYPEFDPSGFFIICVIKGEDWESPVYKKCCKELEELEAHLKSCVEMVQSY